MVFLQIYSITYIYNHGTLAGQHNYIQGPLASMVHMATAGMHMNMYSYWYGGVYITMLHAES